MPQCRIQWERRRLEHTGALHASRAQLAQSSKRQVQIAASKSSAKPNSETRQAAGKRKTTSLTAWHTEFSEARQALKDEGYTGTLQLEKGLRVYEKITERRPAQLIQAAGNK